MNSEKKCISCEQNLENIKTHEISHNSASSDADTTNISGDIVSGDEVSICANCGKEGATNSCNKCKMVKYCNAVCKKKHKTKHKKACERRVTELHDIELFKQPPSIKGDCPICYLRIPTHGDGSRYKTCCGKLYAVDVFMQSPKEIRMHCVLFAEFHQLHPMKSVTDV